MLLSSRLGLEENSLIWKQDQHFDMHWLETQRVSLEDLAVSVLV